MSKRTACPVCGAFQTFDHARLVGFRERGWSVADAAAMFGGKVTTREARRVLHLHAAAATLKAQHAAPPPALTPHQPAPHAATCTGTCSPRAHRPEDIALVRAVIHSMLDNELTPIRQALGRLSGRLDALAQQQQQPQPRAVAS